MIGPNGIGKSNLLEAVELLGSLRSHRCSQDRDLIQWDAPRALLRAGLDDGDQLELELRRQGGRQARRNGKSLDRQLDLIGPLRCIGFSALDLELVRGEPALRRQWLDRVVLQLEPVYADLLGRYNRLLRQRSQLWRRYGQNSPSQRDALLDAFDVQMALVSTRIHRRRQRALRRLEPIARRWQSHLSAGSEELELHYQPGSRLDAEEAEEPWRLAIEEQLSASVEVVDSEQHIVHQSPTLRMTAHGLDTANSCRRRYWLSHVKGWQSEPLNIRGISNLIQDEESQKDRSSGEDLQYDSIGWPSATSFGSMFHRLVEIGLANPAEMKSEDFNLSPVWLNSQSNLLLSSKEITGMPSYLLSWGA